MPSYYYQGRSGDSFVDATIHQSSECCPNPVRPIAETTIDKLDEVEWCPDCVPLGSDSGSESDGLEMHHREIEQLIIGGVCPWCENEYQNVGAHASQMHAEEWEKHQAKR